MSSVQSADGTTIAYERSGEGPALILVTGAFCDRSSPASLAAALAPAFTVYCYDRRGRGDSGDRPPYAIEREVEDLAALAALAAAAGGRPFVFGHSSGAALALEAAAAGVPMARVAAYEPPYTGASFPPAGFAGELAALAASGERGTAAGLFLQSTGAPEQAVAQMRSSPYWPRMESLAHTLSYDITLCNGGVVPAGRLAGIAVPVLALAGGKSPDWAAAAAGEIAAAVPDGRSRVLDGQDHGPADEVLAPALTEFLA
jgi:pimeloyl-ACP methyl ester carboxylesterase